VNDPKARANAARAFLLTKLFFRSKRLPRRVIRDARAVALTSGRATRYLSRVKCASFHVSCAKTVLKETASAKDGAGSEQGPGVPKSGRRRKKVTGRG